MALTPGGPAQVGLGGAQPGLRLLTRADGLELTGIARHQGRHPRHFGAGSQQGLLGARLQHPAEDQNRSGECRHRGNDQAGNGREDSGDDRRHDARHEHGDNRHGDSDLRVRDVGEVVDDPGQEVGSAAATKSCRGQRDEPPVCRGAPVREIGESDVVRAQALPVAKDRARHTESADGHDRGDQQENDRPLAGADDQPAGGGGQGDAGRGRDAAEQSGAQNGPNPQPGVDRA